MGLKPGNRNGSPSRRKSDSHLKKFQTKDFAANIIIGGLEHGSARFLFAETP
jgi:hypothetical protein